MDIKEAYKVMQENCGIEVGDKVRVLRKFSPYEMGCTITWLPEKDDYLYNIFIVSDITYEGNYRDVKGFYFPFFVLEVVERHNSKKTITIDGKDILISRESFEELKKQLLEG